MEDHRTSVIIWQMMQSNNTKPENLDKDFAEILGENASNRPREMMTTVRDPIKEYLQSNPPMDSVVTLIAEWFFYGEKIKLQGVSVLISVNLRELQSKDMLDEIDDQVWDGLVLETVPVGKEP